MDKHYFSKQIKAVRTKNRETTWISINKQNWDESTCDASLWVDETGILAANFDF